jgi:membrane protein DedA with SNARE-associated domain
MNLWTAIAVAGAGSVVGDLIGYSIGRWGGTALIHRFGRLLGGPNRVEEIEARVRRRAGLYIFLTRWLLSPLGPWVNLASGTAGYPWGRFLLWDVIGEFFGVALYISLGQIFSDRVMALDSVLGDLTWGILALTVALVMARALYGYMRSSRTAP